MLMRKPIIETSAEDLDAWLGEHRLSYDFIAACANVSAETVEQAAWGLEDMPLSLQIFMRVWTDASTSHRTAIRKAVASAFARKQIKRSEVVWRIIPGFSRYEVSNQGDVRRRRGGPGSMPGLVLKPTRSNYGHMRVTVYADDGEQRRTTVHQLVALAFIGPVPEGLPCVLHGDGDPMNNRADNLRYGPHKENSADMVRHASEKGFGVKKAWTSDVTDLADVRRANKIKMLARLERMKQA